MQNSAYLLSVNALTKLSSKKVRQKWQTLNQESQHNPSGKRFVQTTKPFFSKYHRLNCRTIFAVCIKSFVHRYKNISAFLCNIALAEIARGQTVYLVL
jgi:hypothetical protein